MNKLIIKTNKWNQSVADKKNAKNEKKMKLIYKIICSDLTLNSYQIVFSLLLLNIFVLIRHIFFLY